MADVKDVCCYIHNENYINSYCCDCDDVICIQCLLEQHQKHSLLTLNDAKSNIVDHLQKFITPGEENEENMLTKIKQDVLQDISNCENDEKQIEEEIKHLSEERKNEIDKCADELISTLRMKSSEYNTVLKDVEKKLTSCETRIFDLSDTGHEDTDLYAQVSLFANIKYCKMISDELCIKKRLMAPKFYVDSEQPHTTELGHIGTMEDVNSDQSSEKMQFPVKIDLQDQTGIHVVTKICPLSETEALIIIKRRLYHLKGTIAEKHFYPECVDDITLLKDDSILILQQGCQSIKRIINKRVLNFTDVKPECISICKTFDNNVLVVFGYKAEDMNDKQIIKFDDCGIQQGSLEFTLNSYDPQYIVASKNNTDAYILFSNYYGDSVVKKIQSFSKEDEKEFYGAVGMGDQKKFECSGMCVNDQNQLLVSDQTHHSVLLLDENLKFVERVLSAEDGLNSPGALGIYKDILWVADGSVIWKFKHSTCSSVLPE